MGERIWRVVGRIEDGRRCTAFVPADTQSDACAAGAKKGALISVEYAREIDPETGINVGKRSSCARTVRYTCHRDGEHDGPCAMEPSVDVIKRVTFGQSMIGNYISATVDTVQIHAHVEDFDDRVRGHFTEWFKTSVLTRVAPGASPRFVIVLDR